MLPETVIDRQVAGQPAVLFLGFPVLHGIGLPTAAGLVEPLGLAVGSRHVGAGAGVYDAKCTADIGERSGDVGRAVVAHHPATLDPLGVEPGHSAAEKADHRWLLLHGQHPDGSVSAPFGAAASRVMPSSLTSTLTERHLRRGPADGHP